MSQLKRRSSKVVAFLLAFAMVATSLAYAPSTADAAKKKVSKVKITKPSTKTLVLKKGKSFKLKVKVTASKKKYTKVTYKSSKKTVATVSKSGKIKAKKKGTTKITVTSKTDKKKKATLTVKVGTPITSVKLTGTKNRTEYYYTTVINQDTESADYGKEFIVRKSKIVKSKLFTKKKSTSITLENMMETVSLKTVFSPSKATYKKVKYTTSNSKVATVNTTTGTILTKGVGTAKITATAADGSGKKATVKVTVTPTKNYDTPAPTAVVDNRSTTVVEDFESYAVGTVWENCTENCDAGQTKNIGKMEVVQDPLNANNKVLKITYGGTDAAYDYNPYFNVDLAKLPNAKATLNNYVALKIKTRVVSNVSDCQYKTIYGYFADYGTITKNMANCCSYEPDNEAVLAEPARYKFLTSTTALVGTSDEVASDVEGIMTNNRYMPQYNTDYFLADEVTELIKIDPTKRTLGFAGHNKDTGVTETAEYATKTLDFDRNSENLKPYLNNSKFDLTFGTTYKGQVTTAGDVHEVYYDDIELVEGEVVAVPATSVTLDITEKEMEVGDKQQLTAVMTPDNTTDGITWTSSNEAVATVSVLGMVTAQAEGTATITAKANDNAVATCTITVKAASAEEIVTQAPKADDQLFGGGDGTETAEGLEVDLASGNYNGVNLKFPAEIPDFSKVKSVKISFKLADYVAPEGGAEGDPVKLTFAVLHKDATSNWDEACSADGSNNGRLYETYTDIQYNTTEGQYNTVTYDPETGIYTATFSLVGQSNMDKAQGFMFARNGSSSAGVKMTIVAVDYTKKAEGEADPTDAYPFLAVPFAQDFEDADAVTSDTFVIAGDIPVEYKATEGVSGSACLAVPGDQYNGPGGLLDNRKGDADKSFYIECYVKAQSEEDIDGKVYYYAGYSSYVGYAKGGTAFDEMYIKGDWYKMHDIVTVPAGSFIDLRIRGSKNFLIDNIKIEEYTDQDITDDDYPEAEPVDHVPFGSDLAVDLTQEPTGYGFTATPITAGGVEIALNGQYQEVRYALPAEVVAGMADSITISMESDDNIAFKLLDANDAQIGSASWNNVTGAAIDLSGYAKDAKIAKVALMSQNGATNVILNSIKVTSTKMTADLTQEPTGYGFTAAATEAGVAIELTGQYQEVRYALPQEVVIADIANIVVDMEADDNVAIKLLDANDAQIGGASWNNTAAKTVDMAAYDQTAKVAKVALMSQNGATNVVLKGITVNASKSIKADLAQEPTGYGFTAAATDAGVAITLTGQYQEVRYALPIECSLAEFEALVVSMEADDNVAIKLLDANDAQIGGASWNNTGDKTMVLNTYDKTASVAKIALMSQNGETNVVLKGIEMFKNGKAELQ